MNLSSLTNIYIPCFRVEIAFNAQKDYLYLDNFFSSIYSGIVLFNKQIDISPINGHYLVIRCSSPYETPVDLYRLTEISYKIYSQLQKQV